MLVSQLHPEVVIVIEQHLLRTLALAGLVLIDVVLDRQQVKGHGLEGQLVQQRGDGVKAAVQDQQLGARLAEMGETWSVSYVGRGDMEVLIKTQINRGLNSPKPVQEIVASLFADRAKEEFIDCGNTFCGMHIVVHLPTVKNVISMSNQVVFNAKQNVLAMLV